MYSLEYAQSVFKLFLIDGIITIQNDMTLIDDIGGTVKDRVKETAE